MVRNPSNKAPRSVHRAFWRAIAEGYVPIKASLLAGVSENAGVKWYREAGGMPPLDLKEPSSRYLSLREREEIAVLHGQGVSGHQIAKTLNRAQSTISRELVRNRPSSHTSLPYRATIAQTKAENRARRPKVGKLAANQRLREYVQARLDRRWSPEQISRRLVHDFPDDEGMRISDEAIYQAIYVQGRGGLRRELAKCLRTGRAIRKPRRRSSGTGHRVIPDELMISQRPPEIEDRAVPGHWEGDLIIGHLHKSAIGTLVERSTRFLFLLHLPEGHAAPIVRNAIGEAIGTLPRELRRSLTWDQGPEMGEHAQLRLATDMAVYFCDPHSPWQRGTNENTNGLLRQYFPKGTDLSIHTAVDLADVAAELNSRPRKTLGWKTPAEALNELLSNAS